MERPSIESLKSFSNMDPHDFEDGDDNDPLLQSHTQPTRPRGMSFKRAINHFTRLSICLAIVGTCCIAVILLVLAIFLAFFEPCLNPVLNSTTYTDTFANISQINLAVTASRTLVIRPLPSAAPNVIESVVRLSATTDPALSEVNIDHVATDSAYSLSFSRAAVPRTLERCSYEEVTLSLGSFEQNLNGTFQLRDGSVDVLQIQPQFASFSVYIGSGPITITQLRCTDMLWLWTGSGSIKVSSLQTSLAYLNAPLGAVSINTLAAEELYLVSGDSISFTSLALSSNLRKCAVTIEGAATVDLAYVQLSTSSVCIIRVTTQVGDISLAISGFSGDFSATTQKGLVNIPGFPSCDNQSSCTGTANPDGPSNQQIFLETESGSIELVFV